MNRLRKASVRLVGHHSIAGKLIHAIRDRPWGVVSTVAGIKAKRIHFMQIICEVKDNGDISVACVCLKTDSWLDYLAFKQDARNAFARSDVRAYARFMRAGLLCLFAHVEAVVNEICDMAVVPATNKDQALCIKICNIHKEATQLAKAKKLAEGPPSLRLEKNLRDMIAHPGIDKSFEAAGTPNAKKEDYAATYARLDFQALERFEGQVSPWIDAVCAAFGVVRVEDVDGARNDFTAEIAKRMGGPARTERPEGGPT